MLSCRNFALATSLLLAACSGPWNNPYPDRTSSEKVLYSSFSERPKHLDPVQSYSSNEIVFTAQIYEPPLQYDYLKRPYTLIPSSAEAIPQPRYYDAQGKELRDASHAGKVAQTVYEIRVKRGIRFQPHPAFAQDDQGRQRYMNLSSAELENIYALKDFSQTGSRELTAQDFVYQIKRLAHPKLHSPILGLMSEYIVGLADYVETLKKAQQELSAKGDYWLDLSRFPLAGVEVVDDYTYRIKLKGQYPQFTYWLAMPFFAPVPAEADRFYSQPGLVRKNITLDWYPVGTGPFMLTENNPNRVMILQRNPNFHGETYPSEGDPTDAAAGLLADAGQPLPFLDKAVFTLEKEGIPRWNKFLQGYYDNSGIASDSFDQAVQFSAQGEAAVTEEMQKQGIRLATSVAVATYYMAFNMQDPVVGGNGERARKLRQAISIAIDYEEYVSIFQNGRGIPGNGPIPPGIFGFRDGEAGMNPLVYDWDGRAPVRKSIDVAKKLLAEAGYPNGVDESTGKPLVLNFDVTARGPEAKSGLDWMTKQFAKLNIQLAVRPTDYNRFQEKIRKGNAQLFEWGWHADYPDPENFMFLLYGPQSKVKTQGENAANYANPEFDRLFEQMKTMPNSPERQQLIDRMVAILRQDAPWLWGFHPKDYALYHSWYKNIKPNKIAYNTLKYIRVDAAERAQLQSSWNRPVLWPAVLIVLVLAAGVVPALANYRRRQRAGALPQVGTA
jgi:ABC-type transport system substrate-binding protein